MKKILIIAILAIAAYLVEPESPAEAQYTAEKGDTMYKIAQKYNMGLNDLLSLNKHISNPSMIRVGDFIVVRSQDQIHHDLVDYAKSLQDTTKYVYGGNNFPYQTDCSSWMQGVFAKFGYKLPRTSAEQALIGQKIKKIDDLAMGDLLFFASNPANGIITHVGLKMDGAYWISNLNSGSDVKILSTWGKWSREHFMWGTRITL